MMKAKLKFIVPLLIIVAGVSALAMQTRNNDPKKDKILISVINYVLSRGHFVQKKMDDNFSEEVYKRFIDRLDPNKHYFTQKDIKDFLPFKDRIDDQLKQKDLSFYNLVYGRFSEKIKSAKKYYKELLSKPFNFNTEEVLDVDYDKMPFATDEKQLMDYWRKELKLEILGKIKELEDQQNEKLKKDKNFKKKSFTQLEIEARKEVLKNMDDLYIRIGELDNSDWFSSFLNSVVQSFDPHTIYMSPKIRTRFNQDISGKIEGIGARLEKKGIYTSVLNLISGGPAWKQGQLEPGDIILKVAQGDAKPLDIVGMRLENAIKFIKGKKGTEVRLTVKKKLDGTIKTISIIRDEVNLEDTFVKSSVVIKDGKKYGVIDLPKFYINFKNPKNSNSAQDMKDEINRLKKGGVKGLLIDLRNNGGGSLKTAIEISGLFFKKGPVVQVKYRGEKPVIKEDTDDRIQWKGPLVILVNELSASASEIFTAAMKDYERAVIIGGNQTFGKGTVQNVWPLNRVFKYDQDLGALKMTIQKFYRINGGSTQIKGVHPDIVVPDKYSYLKYGERDLEDALPWDKVAKAKYTTTNSYANFDSVVYRSKLRISKNTKFKLIDNYAKWLKKNKGSTSFSLNYNKFEKQIQTRQDSRKKYQSAFKYQSNLKFISPNYELGLIKKDSSLKDKRVMWHKNLSKDIYIDESLNVLSELKMNPK